jgi:UDP:flavonoid glycosyltransferase YjiC (YdhE family)
MRILFTGVPSAGHILPMLPLAEAADAAGHVTALMTGAELASVVRPFRLLAAGPSQAELMAEASRRLGGRHPGTPGPAAIEYFTGTRVDLTFDEALEHARSFAPDLIVADTYDFVGQVVAAALAIPWAEHASARALPEPLRLAMEEAMAAQYAKRSLTPTPRVALADPVPGLLQAPGYEHPADRIPVRPAAYRQPGMAWTPPVFAGREDRPRVLVTLGTTVLDQAALTALVAAVAAADVNVIVTGSDPGAANGAADMDGARIRWVGFVPMASLLASADLVVSSAGAGTVISTLAAGVPMVLRPFHAEQPWNAERAAEAGVAITITEPRDAGAAVTAILGTPSYRAAARKAADAIARIDSPAHALRILLDRVGAAANP